MLEQESNTAEDSKFDEAVKAEKVDEFIENLCAKLRCTVLVDDLERLDIARLLLQKLQYREVFERVLGRNELQDLDLELEDLGGAEVDTKKSEEFPEQVEEEECQGSDIVDLPEDAWHGYFKGFQILSEVDDFNISENKKCIEINPHSCGKMLESFLRSGIRCFCIDLFIGTEIENQQLIVRLRESEIVVSKEYSFPVLSTLFAKLSPRLQYTGDLDNDLIAKGNPDDFILKKDDKIILTAERAYSMRCYRKRVYVNACFLLGDVQVCDFICIGPDIQLQVRRVTETSLHCIVVIGGVLESRMPVLFPSRCNKFRVSLEELENITFAKEVGLNIIVSHIVGSKEYFEDLKQILSYFKADSMRLCARVVLNDLKGPCDEYLWAADGYDGFVIELSPPSKNPNNETQMLHICPAADAFLRRAYHLKKPIVFNPALIVNHTYNIDPDHYFHIFFFPDKYIFKCLDLNKSFYFFFLQNAIFCEMPAMTLSDLPYCDQSFAGSDSLARSVVAAAYEMDAKCIIVRGISGRSARKIAHFRPKVPIIFITDLKSAIDYISIFHNVIMLYYKNTRHIPHHRSTYKQMLLGILYAKSRKIISHDNYVVMVYNMDPEGKIPDQHIAFKFDEKHFPLHLQKVIR